MTESFASIAGRVNQQVNVNTGAGGSWGAAEIDPSAPVYHPAPPGDHSYIGLFGELKILGRYGNWTGGNYGGGHLSPSFDFASFDLSNPQDPARYAAEYARFKPGGEFWENPQTGYFDEFDRLSRSHDLLYQDANLTGAQKYFEAGQKYAAGLITKAQLYAIRDEANGTQERAMREADVWFIEYSKTVEPSNAYGKLLKELSTTVFGLWTDAFYISEIDSFHTREVLQQVGSIYGSRLGAMLGGADIFKTIGSGLGIIAGDQLSDLFTGEDTSIWDSLLVARDGMTPVNKLLIDALDEAGIDIGAITLANISKYYNTLLVNVAQDLGLSGVTEHVFIQSGEAIGDYLTRILSSGEIDGVVDFFQTISTDIDFAEIGDFLIDVAIDFFGSELNDFVASILDEARGLVTIDSRAEGAIAELGSIIGAVIGSLELPFLGSQIGATIGHVLGSIAFEVLDRVTFGLFGDIVSIFTSTPHPESWVYIGYDDATGQFQMIGQDWKKDGIDRSDILKIHDGNLQLSDAYIGYLNGVLDSIGATVVTSNFYEINPNLGVKDPNTDYLSHAMIGFNTDKFYVRTTWGGTYTITTRSNQSGNDCRRGCRVRIGASNLLRRRSSAGSGFGPVGRIVEPAARAEPSPCLLRDRQSGGEARRSADGVIERQFAGGAGISLLSGQY